MFIFSKLIGCFFAFMWSTILVIMIPDQLMFLHAHQKMMFLHAHQKMIHLSVFTPLIPLTFFGSLTVGWWGWLLAQAWSAWGMSCFSEIKFGWCESLRAENGGVGSHMSGVIPLSTFSDHEPWCSKESKKQQQGPTNMDKYVIIKNTLECNIYIYIHIRYLCMIWKWNKTNEVVTS